MREAHRSSLLDAEISRIPPDALALHDRDAVRRIIERGLDKAIEWTHSEAFSVPYAAACPVPGAVANDYLYRLHEFEDGCLLWGIHFEGLKQRLPFVHIEYSTFDPVERLATLKHVARGEFALFAPTRLSFFGPVGLPYDLDTTCYGATLESLRAIPLPENYERVTVERLRDVEFYPEYAQQYERLYARSPEHPSHLERIETLEEAVQNALMFRVLLDGAPAGFFALRRTHDRYLDGYYIIEEILSEEHRGQRCAAAIQRRIFEALPANPDAVLYGHIDERNVASWRTALSVGRKRIYTAYWEQL